MKFNPLDKAWRHQERNWNDLERKICYPIVGMLLLLIVIGFSGMLAVMFFG